ncbi:FecCD family ABC transporter permease [Lentzea sp. NPDC058436]|uniref:FecCD family ABC transporter permease n=1 Tax=Lentzea sp. NPDC058436 TaxID=3346499 RepID=UPI003657E44E
MRPTTATLALTGAGLLAAGVAVSLAVGSNPVPLGDVLAALTDPAHPAAGIVVEQRVPRTVLAVLLGAALAAAGALMQSLTRNPLADPGILGINAGAALAVVLAVAVTGVTGVWFYLWFAFAGAAVAAVVVHLLGAAGGFSTPGRLALAGVAISAAAGSLVQTVILADQAALDEFRFWATGSLEGRRWEIIAATGPFLAAGLVAGLVCAPALNALALGDDAAASLGVRAKEVRAGTMLAVTLLCGAATAAAGPIGFVGLGVPFLVRALVGPDLRRVLGWSLVAGPALMLFADTAGRLVGGGRAELGVGVVTALLGAPVFVALVRRKTAVGV